MRRIAVINQKGGVGKTTTCRESSGAALARLGRRVVLVDMDAQANLSMHMAVEVAEDRAELVLACCGGDAARGSDAARRSKPAPPRAERISSSPGPSSSSRARSGARRCSAIAVEDWEREERALPRAAPADYVLFDCPPSLGLLSINALAAASEVLIALQTEFFALQGMSTLVDVVQLLKRRLHHSLEITGILPCLYDSRLKLAREVLAEIRTYFPGKVFRTPDPQATIKLAEAPSFGQTIFSTRPTSNGALDYCGRGGTSSWKASLATRSSRRIPCDADRGRSRGRADHRASRAKQPATGTALAPSVEAARASTAAREPKSTARSPSHRRARRVSCGSRRRRARRAADERSRSLPRPCSHRPDAPAPAEIERAHRRRGSRRARDARAGSFARSPRARSLGSTSRRRRAQAC